MPFATFEQVRTQLFVPALGLLALRSISNLPPVLYIPWVWRVGKLALEMERKWQQIGG